MNIEFKPRIQTSHVLLVIVYNLILLAGASYLVVAHDMSAWIYVLALIFAASWNTETEKEKS